MLRSGLLALALSAALAAPAFAAWMVPPSPYRAKDFTIVKHDGWYHVYYIRNDTTAPFDSTERDLGHAMSRDFYNWFHLPPVLEARPGSWDNHKIWAPSILKVDGVFYMFYTGVTNEPGVYTMHQRIGLAFSTDLVNWNRLDQPLLSCIDVPWTFCDPQLATGGEFRDPFVMANPSGPGWLMYYNTRPAAAASTFIAGVAQSPGGLTEWMDLKPLWATQQGWSGNFLVESPHLFQRDGLWYLMFTGDAGQPLKILTGPDPTGEPGTWTQRGSLGAMLGVNTGLWFASETFLDGLVEYFAFVNYDRVDVRRMEWNQDWTFSLKPPDLFRVHTMSWSAPMVTEGGAVQIQLQAVNAIGIWTKLAAWGLDGNGVETPIPVAALGLPDSVLVNSTTITIPWTARPQPGAPDSLAVDRIVVGVANRTAMTPPIDVYRDPYVYDGTSDRDRRRPREQVVLGRAPVAGTFRAAQDGPLGERALLVDLAGPAPVRIDVYDLAGRRIRNLADREFPRGATVLAWDGRDAGGAPVRPGVYFARLRSPALAGTVRLLLTR